LGKHYLAQENFQDAIRYLTRSDKSGVPTALRTQAKLRLAECYARIGESEKGLRILESIDADFRNKYVKGDVDQLRTSLLELVGSSNTKDL
jgi:predicted negative regulator of RcsB-dependent stress response